MGVETGDLEFDWNGLTYGAGVCGGDTCRETTFVPDGEYSFEYCATRGELTQDEEGTPVCELELDVAGEAITDCVSTTFELQGGATAVPVELTLGE
jgi:hypothetical protein